MKRVILGKWLLFTALIAQILLFCACGNDTARAEEGDSFTLGENIFIDGVNVSDMSLASVRAALDTAHAQKNSELHFTIAIEGTELEVSGSEIPIVYNEEEVLLQAASLKRHYPLKNAPRELACSPSVDIEALRAALNGILAPFNAAPQNAYATFDIEAEGRFIYTEEQAGREIDVIPLAAAVKAAIESGEAQSDTAWPESVLGARFEAEVHALHPGYTIENAKADTELISEFHTSFKGSVYGKKNRVFNIEKAAGLINGVELAPGEEFDMNRTLGDRNLENGWKEAAAIRDATYVQEYGGGVCQVSSTLYNAVLMADLTVTERWHHSWPLGYVAIGRDATISTGGPNFKFQNTSGANIVICAYADKEEKTIHVELYGRRDKSGVTIKLKSYKVDTLEDLGEDLVLDEMLPFNTREVVREKRVGSVAETYKEYYDASGELLKRELVVRDKYRSVKGIVSVSRDIYYGYTAAVSPAP
ncbi:MAG TPA: VanW family protein [Clostridia bacterium]|nr:VanW family protein [Clostridia bacterium]